MSAYYNSYGNNSFSEGIWSGIKRSFKQGSALSRLIYINIAAFIIIKLVSVFFLLAGYREMDNFLLPYLGVPAYPYNLLRTPWTIVTYMFTQFGFFHLLFNMLWLYWFGSIFLNYFSERKLTGIYILGGVSGAIVYMAAYAIFPAFATERYFSWAVGASASIMAIVFAVCTYLPNHRIYIFLIGPVKLIHLALFTAAIDIISIPSGNAGGHIAHLGGALFGYLFTLGIRKNRDIASGIINLFEKIGKLFVPRKNMRGKYKKKVSDMNDREYNEYKKQKDDRINDILDKISKSGYESLTKEEKEILFKSGRKN
ncbi:rhomboid family intramembrane serine protease [uncultured Sanguibacteroides sp.]|uniref:rhomboid family protein n=1 Tax=uncultured Sanguibacteroides sp. TaxID=1635151 RepID=UPI0025DF3DAF|nr:rhomboid family intramembrane serine protease [uncultured Sanguibacteroides sp.]